ncbi:MAG: hypothetical protein KY433_08100 [Actinobacteria bacterium]|nr:hypothetical protein [Actinomycetota bacterium]
MVRRAAALAIGVLVLVALVFAVNGCLNSRQEQALKDYNRAVSTLIRDADANADAFYDTLSAGGQAEASTDVQSEINQLRFRAQALTRRAERIDVPDEMRPAHRNVLLSLSLLEEAMGKVAEKLPAALSTDSATAVPAVRAIAGEIQAFDAANVVYNRRAAPLIKEVLDEHEIGGQTIQNASFVQNYGWLQPSTVARRINSQAGRGAGDAGTTEPAPGLHGHGLLGVSVGDVTLQPGQANRIPASSDVAFNVKVANQGDNAETDVRVRVRIRGAGDPITAQKVIDQTMPKTETTVAVPLGEAPPIGQPVTITVEVLPVAGEKNTQNNSASYPALFVRS